MMLGQTCARAAQLSQSGLRAIGRARYSCRVVQEHDVLLLRQKHPKAPSKRQLSPPIRPDTTIKLGYGATLQGSDVLGRPVPDVVADSQGNMVRLTEVTLSQYLTNQPRVATPIYPQDASMIVSILDINVPVPGEDPQADAGPPMEIFEAGTGMGSLTLHIARALHGANPAVPPELRKAILAAPYKPGMLLRDTATDDSPINGPMPHAPDLGSPELEAQLQSYRASRRAILHSLDISPSTSRKAHVVVQNFCRGRYILDVDFHLRTIKSYLDSRLADNGRQAFLSHAVLDLPASSSHAELVVEALKPGGRLVVFFPSVTQVLEFVVWASETNQSVYLDRVIELMSSSWSPGFTDAVGGREWDVRIVMPRKAKQEADTPESSLNASASGPADNTKPVHVCRPKVGNLVGGGGFLAVFTKKMSTQSQEDDSDLPSDGADSTP